MNINLPTQNINCPTCHRSTKFVGVEGSDKHVRCAQCGVRSDIKTLETNFTKRAEKVIEKEAERLIDKAMRSFK